MLFTGTVGFHAQKEYSDSSCMSKYMISPITELYIDVLCVYVNLVQNSCFSQVYDVFR